MLHTKSIKKYIALFLGIFLLGMGVVMSSGKVEQRDIITHLGYAIGITAFSFLSDLF